MRQYPLKPDAQQGIEPVIKDLIKAGVIVKCEDSPCNTPIFPVKKQLPSVGWRMVQDLQAVNNAVIQRAPCVPDPYTLLNTLRPDAKYFTVVDISNAFFSVPVAKDSQFWFAFTFKGQVTHLPDYRRDIVKAQQFIPKSCQPVWQNSLPREGVKYCYM